MTDGTSKKEIYLHIKKSTEVEGTDPKYHPYCYVLGHKIRYNYSSNWKTYYWNGANEKADGSRVNWSDTQINHFYNRMRSNTIDEELANAGIKAKYGLILKLSNELKSEKLTVTQSIRRWREPTGSIIELGGTKITNNKVFAKFYIYTRKGYEKKPNETYGYFTFFIYSD